ncbi:acyl-CoA dehydrogenase [Rhodococcus sp. MS16]|uniref:acyl-CoA dehydrogenase family protein n=1 Tax=Rhodococcus sp. MS16 TaxID=2579941 RepID=UPI000E22990C|nr:acyl-CoA dehydrogenase family protein [Rhodococcus sp. MS16]NRI65421.1 acyl-CoA dehydrogenase [Rhodococcus sp. MS16]
MKLVANQDQLDLQAMSAAVLAKQCPISVVRELAEPMSESSPDKLMTALAEVGVLGLAIDEEYGGGGASLYELGVFFREAGRVLCPSIVYSTLQFGIAVGRLATPEQRRRYLPALAEGRLRAGVAAWNPGDAGDIRPTLTATPAPGGWLLNGTLPFAVNASMSDVVLVTARTSVFAEPERLICAFVERTAEGWNAVPLSNMSGERLSRVELVDVFASDAAVSLGGSGNGLSADDLRWVANAAVALQCMEMAGGGAAVLDRTVDYIAQREQFGRPIGSFQAAQHIVADMHIALEGARLAAAHAVWWVARGESATRAVAIAKMQCNEAYKRATLDAHQLHGGMGYVLETDLHLWSERAKVTEIRYGTADIAAGWLQKELNLA